MSKSGYKNSPTGVLDDQKGKVGVNRHWHDLQQTRATSLPMAKVCPTMNVMLQGNTHVKMSPRYAVVTNPTKSPVYSPIDVTSVFVFCPLRLYSKGLYGNNYLEIDAIDDISLPLINDHINDGWSWEESVAVSVLRGSLLNRLGYPCDVIAPSDYNSPLQPVGISFPVNQLHRASDFSLYDDDFGGSSFYNQKNNAVSILAYFDACRYFFADAYDKGIPFISTTLKKNAANDAFDIERREYLIDYTDLVERIYQFRFNNSITSITLGIGSVDDFTIGLPFLVSGIKDSGIASVFEKRVDNICVTDGLFPCTYKPDYFSAWYDPEETDKLVMSTTNDIQSIRITQAEFNKDASLLVRGKRYGDYNEVLTGATLELKDHPIFVGSDRLRIAFDDKNSTAATDGQPLGTPYGKGNAHNFKTKDIDFTTQEAGVLMCLTSAVPTVFHSDAPNPMHRYKKFGDIPNRFYDGVGFQSLTVGDCADFCLSINSVEVGTQPFYMEAMVGYDVVDGLLATSGYRSYTLQRVYDFAGYMQIEATDEYIAEHMMSKYIGTSDYDYIFPAYAPIGLQGVSTSPYQDNIFILIDFDLRVNQPLTNQVIATNSI